MVNNLVRYQLNDKSTLPRETVLLVSTGCSWGKCSFCDYKDDFSKSALICDSVNKCVLKIVRGVRAGVKCLEVTCSASYTEIPFSTMFMIREVCRDNSIRTVVLEGHYLFREYNKYFEKFFEQYGIKTIFRCGVETFAENFREGVIHKGLGSASVEDIAQYFDWVNLMYGMKGQTFEQLQEDILLAEQHFSRVNLSIYTTIPNGIERDDQAISQFYRSDLYQQLLTNPKFEIYDEWDKENYHNVGDDK